MSDNDISRIKQNIEQLQDQNAIDFQQWKRLGQEINKLDEKIKTSDCNLNLVIKKIKADYENLRRIVIDENIQVELNEKINNVIVDTNEKIDNVIVDTNEKIDNVIVDTNEKIEEFATEINSQLDNIVPLLNQFVPFNNYENNYKPLFSSSYSVGDSTFRPLYTEIDTYVKELSYCKSRGIVFCYHLIYEDGQVKIVQLDKTEMEHSEERVDYALNKLLENNFYIRAIKLHTQFTTSDIDNNTNFWTSFHNAISRLVNKHNDVELFYLLNEVPTITSNVKYYANIKSEIDYLKSNNKKVSISNMGVSELKNNLFNNDVDILSVNIYPFMSVNGLNTTNIECLGSWENSISELYSVTKSYNKDVFISETGCMDKEKSLEEPGNYLVEGAETNGRIKRIYYNGLFSFFQNTFVKEIFLWDGGSYSPYRHATSLEVMRNNLGGGKNV